MEIDITPYAEVLDGKRFWLGTHEILGRNPDTLVKLMEDRAQTAGALFATSGSTGVPKWVWLEPEALYISARGVVDELQLTSSDRCLKCLPDFHVGGFMVALRAYVSGAACYQMTRKWAVNEFIQLIQREGITILSLVPTQMFDIVRAGVKAPESLRCVLVGGAALADDLLARACELGWPLYLSYGMTEAASTIAYADVRTMPRHELKMLPHWKARLGDDAVLEIAGKSLFTGSWMHSQRGWEFFSRVDDWFSTRDRFERNERNWRFLGRVDRVVKIFSEQVDLDALERDFIERGCISHEICCLVAVPDERAGSILHVFLLSQHPDPVGLVREWNQSRPSLHQIRRISVVDDFPRTALGKVDRAALAMMLPLQDFS